MKALSSLRQTPYTHQSPEGFHPKKALWGRSGPSYGQPKLTKTQYALTQSALDLIARRRHGDNHTVAAAALDSAGQIHTGLNVHHFTGGPCAELVVIGQAATVSKGRPLTAIVAALDAAPDAGVAGGVAPPCGRCRQVLFDYFPEIGRAHV